MAIDEQGICKEVARFYAGRDWNLLSDHHKLIVYNLERLNYLIAPKPHNGFVGKLGTGK